MDKQNQYFEKLELSLDEKIILLFGVIAFWGDGEITKAEIDVLDSMLDILNIEPDGLVYRDTTDKLLCKKERLAWVLDQIKIFFMIDMDSLSGEEIKDEFRVLVKVVVDEVKAKYSKEQAKEKLESLRNEISSFIAYGGVSPLEKKFLKIFDEEIQETGGCLYWIIGLIIVVAYEIIWG